MGWLENIGMRQSRDGRTHTVYYKFYHNMMGQCHAQYGKLFGKIQVCERWRYDFWKFVEDVKPLYNKQYKEGYWMGRHDVTKNYEPGNVFFGPINKVMWTRRTTHKINIKGVIKHVPEIHQILTTQGIKINEQSLRQRVTEGKKRNIGRQNERNRYKWKGKYLSLKEICKLEGANYPRAKYWKARGNTIEEAVDTAKNNLHPQRMYVYKGKKYNQTELSEVLSQELKGAVLPGGMRNRLKRGLSIEECLVGFKQAKLK